MKLGLEGRKLSCNKVKEKISIDDKVIWMHAASLGEYEQGLPVLEKLKEEFPNYKTLVTFFSPSGYENVAKKNHQIADVICYLPFDKKNLISDFVSNFNTEFFFTVKYDFWYHLLDQLKRRNVKIYTISALFYENQIFFKSYGKWFISQLIKNVDWFFHQTQHSTDIAKRIGLAQSSTSGDTRFDRVRQILKRDNFVKWIDVFKQEKTTIVFGSSWESEEEIAKMIVANGSEAKIIIAPHDLKRVEYLKTIFPKAILYSEYEKYQMFNSESQVLIIDCIGLLSKIYSYADIAVVGGGFHGKGLHNILEPATFGIPVFFGNQYKKNPEADELILQNGGQSFANEMQTADELLKLLTTPELTKQMGRNAGEFVAKQPNATDIILKKILTYKVNS